MCFLFTTFFNASFVSVNSKLNFSRAKAKFLTVGNGMKIVQPLGDDPCYVPERSPIFASNVTRVAKSSLWYLQEMKESAMELPVLLRKGREASCHLTARKACQNLFHNTNSRD